MNISCSIRPIDKSEIDQLLKLCQAHAVYEKLPFVLADQMMRLEKDLFVANPKLYCLVAEVGYQLVGYTTFMKQYATWDAREYLYLDCLFIEEDYRSLGIGELLISKVRQKAALLECNLIQWQTPSFNKRAMKFYYRIGASSKTKERFFLKV